MARKYFGTDGIRGRVGEYAEIIGGVVLILIGLKILLQHLGIIVGLI